MRALALRSLPLVTLGLLSACAPGGGAESGALEIVRPGKADNFYSNVATEFEMSGTVRVAMTEDEFADELTRNERITERLTAVGLYLTAYVTDKFEGVDKNGDGVISEDEIFFRNVGYGGFYAMVRNFSVETEEITAQADGYDVNFTLDVGGPKNLLSLIPRDPEATPTSAGLAFSFRMPKGEAVDPDSVPRTQIRNFDPDKYAGELETHTLTARVLPEPGNAYPAFRAFFADGVLDITLFYGYDYNTSRSDLREAEEAFYTLTDELGFEAPARSLEALTRDSGPFTKEVTVNGRPARIEVRMFTEPMFTGARRVQHDLALSEITTRDVFFYNGHAGPYYGFYLDANKEAQVDYLEFATAPFTNKQQLVIAQGCQTYSQYADMLYANDAKSEANLDVITTVNYSYGIGTMELLKNLVRTSSSGAHIPTDFYEIVADLNAEWWNRQKQVFYGVMGIDGNEQLHPYANTETLGRACAKATDCGDPSGNACATLDGSRVCGARALAESACPAGASFGYLGESGSLTGGVCY